MNKQTNRNIIFQHFLILGNIQLESDTVDWLSADQLCTRNHGNIATHITINDVTEISELMRQADVREVWIGANQSETSWAWVNREDLGKIRISDQLAAKYIPKRFFILLFKTIMQTDPPPPTSYLYAEILIIYEAKLYQMICVTLTHFLNSKMSNKPSVNVYSYL